MSEQSLVATTIEPLKWENHKAPNRLGHVWRASSILGTYTVMPLSKGAELSLERRALR